MHIDKYHKRKWFERRLLKYEIFYYAYSRYGNNYTLIEYAKNAPILVHRHNIDEIISITEYFEGMSYWERFFYARKIALKHKRENRDVQLKVFYSTVKSHKRELDKLL